MMNFFSQNYGFSENEVTSDNYFLRCTEIRALSFEKAYSSKLSYNSKVDVSNRQDMLNTHIGEVVKQL